MFKNNKIILIDEKGNSKSTFFVKGLKFVFQGKNSTVKIHKPIPRFKKCKIICGDDVKIEIGSSKYGIKRLIILATAKGVECSIGKNFLATNFCNILLHREKNLKVKIGDNCMFGTNITLRCSDAHTIFHQESRKIENKGKDIEIGNHCWLATDVTVLKGVKISDNNIIGTRSLVTKSCLSEYTLSAGIPAKTIKYNVCWAKNSPDDFQ